MFDSDHARRGFTSPEGETGLSQHQEGSSSPDEVQTLSFKEALSGNPCQVSPVGDVLVGRQERINSHIEVFGPDVGNGSWDPGGPISHEYQPHACRLGNEALEEGMVTRIRSNGTSIL
jgi:hypothetical protein